MPLIETCEMLTLDPPEFVRVTVCVCCAPIVMLPNASLLGLRASTPGSDPSPVPSPARLNVAVPFDASLVIVVVAPNDATALGANEMPIEVLYPAAIVSGRWVAAREKYWLEIAMLLTVTVASPEFFTVIDRVLVVPAATFPKSRVGVEIESVPDCCWVSDLPTLKPWHPARIMRAANRNTACAAFKKRFEGTALSAIVRILVDP